MSKLSRAFDSVKKYFDWNSKDQPDVSGFTFAVKANDVAVRTFAQSFKHYFDLQSAYRTADKTANDIMLLANAEGVTGGRFDSSTMTVNAGYQFTEKDFVIRLNRNGDILLKCDASFAEKVKALPSVSAVTALAQNLPSSNTRAKPSAPK